MKIGLVLEGRACRSVFFAGMLDAFVIAPKDSSRYKRLERDSTELTSWYMDGFNIAKERTEDLKVLLEG